MLGLLFLQLVFVCRQRGAGVALCWHVAVRWMALQAYNNLRSIWIQACAGWVSSLSPGALCHDTSRRCPCPVTVFLICVQPLSLCTSQLGVHCSVHPAGLTAVVVGWPQRWPCPPLYSFFLSSHPPQLLQAAPPLMASACVVAGHPCALTCATNALAWLSPVRAIESVCSCCSAPAVWFPITPV